MMGSEWAPNGREVKQNLLYRVREDYRPGTMTEAKTEACDKVQAQALALSEQMVDLMPVRNAELDAALRALREAVLWFRAGVERERADPGAYWQVLEHTREER